MILLAFAYVGIGAAWLLLVGLLVAWLIAAIF